MTPKKAPTLQPVEKCVCGRRPYVNEAWPAGGTVYSIECGWECWRGPRRPTKLRAVNAWNKLMQFNYAAGGKR